MHMSSKTYYLLLLLVLLFVCPLISAQTTMVAEDESGTLVMAARTRLAAVISVDSEVHQTGQDSDAKGRWTDGERKLVDVGKTGACALEGYLGPHNEQVGVASYLRNWVNSHPTEGPDEGFDALLKETARAWNEAPRVNFLEKQAFVSTYLTCVDVVNGNPVIIRGKTYQKSDGSADFERIFVPHETILYVGGVISTSLFRGLLRNPSGLETLGPEPSWKLNAYFNIGRQMQLNSSAINAFKIYIVVERSGVDSSLNDIAWNLNTIRNIFAPFYKSVEQYFGEEVGPPNQVRIVTNCGRFSTTVEANPWPTCPIKNEARP